MTKRRPRKPVDAYFRGLPGRWRPGPKGKKSDDSLEPRILEKGLALEAETGHKVVCWCEECGVVIARIEGNSSGDDHILGRVEGTEWEWSEPLGADLLAAPVGDHRHDDDVEAGLIRWYRLRAIGTWKEARVSTVPEMLANHPSLTRGGHPVPSLAAMNDALLRGRHDPPRSAGIEFPPLQFDPEAWPELRLEIILRRPALVETEIPAGVVTMAALDQWWDDKLNSFTEAARAHHRGLILSAGFDMDGLEYDSPEWWAALAKVNALMANTLLVLEGYDS